MNIEDCIGQISGTLECEYGRNSMVIGETILTSKSWQGDYNFDLRIEI